MASAGAFSQIGSYIQFDPYKVMKVKARLDFTPGQTKMKYVKYFVLTEEPYPDLNSTQTKIPVGFAAYKLKKYLIPDLNVDRAFKQFRRYYYAPFIGVPFGAGLMAFGVITHSNNTFNLSDGMLAGYSFYFLAGTLAVVVYSIFKRYKSWDILNDAVRMHNSVLYDENHSYNRLKLRPTLVNTGLGIQPVLGLNLSFSLD